MSREEQGRGGRGGHYEPRSGRDSGRDAPRGGRGPERDAPRGGRDSGRDSGRGGSRFQYQRRDAEGVKKRGEQGGGDFDKYIDDSVKMFKPADGDNVIRILPPTWEDAKHFGLDVFVHYGVGPDSQTYLCLDKMKGEPCPICDERARAVKDNDIEYADKLKPVKRILVYLIDRNSEKDGPVIWSMPWTIDRDLCNLVVDKRSGELLPIDDPDNGYDVEFSRSGKGDRTKYIGLAVARRESPVGNARWLDSIIDAPLPSLLRYFEYDHINKVFGGQADGVSARGTKLDRDQDEGLRYIERGGRGKPDDVLNYEQIHEMTYDEMCAVIDAEKLNIDPQESKDDPDLADWICEVLKLTAAPKRAEPAPRGKLDELRARRRSVE